MLPAILLAAALSATVHTTAVPPSRYFHHGDGNIRLQSAKDGSSFSGTYRHDGGVYNQAALQKIHRVFGTKYGNPTSTISPRLMEFLDFLQDRLCPGSKITIISGYRSPQYNSGLRNGGKLAAKASLHQYGMAADIKMEGVDSENIWNFIKNLGFGGTGYYHGASVHVDVGPARFWDEKSSGVGLGLADDNKLIGIVADKDIYLPGEEIGLRFIRVTVFPIGVRPSFRLERKGRQGGWKKTDEFSPSFPAKIEEACPHLSDLNQLSGIRWHLPLSLKGGRYRVAAKFCGNPWEDMPSSIHTPEIEVFIP